MDNMGMMSTVYFDFQKTWVQVRIRVC